eukprot:13548928-Alexandrium_andersonii.AAC.1
MSASLVGSEMCIRDSTSPPGAGAVPAPTGRSEAPVLSGARGVRQVGPVSYTHLTLPTICSV